MEIIKNVFFSNLLAPWQETFDDAGDGDGGGGRTIWDHLAQFWDHFGTILYYFKSILDQS